MEQVDIQKRFVRLCDARDDGFVEFEFSIADPSLFVEMILPRAEFDDFCKTNAVTFLTPAPSLTEGGDTPPEDDAAEWRWSLHDATHKRFK